MKSSPLGIIITIYLKTHAEVKVKKKIVKKVLKNLRKMSKHFTKMVRIVKLAEHRQQDYVL